jgi:REP element-mobilizing transposase RayT
MSERGRSSGRSAGVSPAPGGGWRFRHYLPHYDQAGIVQAITLRLADALPVEVAARLRSDCNQSQTARARQIESYLDAGHGACYLQEPGIASLVESALHHFDRARYHLIAWVVMPNHVHVIIRTLPGYSLGAVVHSWKSFTAKQANRLLGRTGPFWQVDYFDRVIRDERHLSAAVQYVHHNPEKAGLVDRAEDWPYSSIGRCSTSGGDGRDARAPRQPTHCEPSDGLKPP